MRGELPVTAISAHAYPYVSDKYWIMKSGASMGEGYGPIIVSKKYKTIEELREAKGTIGQPGKLTTANLLLKVWFGDIRSIEMDFDRLIDAVLNDEIDAGLLIHEGQITWESYGLNNLADFGELWQAQSGGLPLPLGLDCVRKDLGLETAQAISTALQESIRVSYDNQDASIPYALEWGRGISAELGGKFVKMYVNEITLDMGDRGKQALAMLFKMGAEKGIIPEVGEFELV
jgi:1,4-dihydroxy-6-naphthoate synthase